MNEKFLAALIAMGLSKEQATVYATIITITDETKIDEIVTAIKGTIPAKPDQSEIDRRVTEGVKTAITNYESKHNLKDGKIIEIVPPVIKDIVPPVTGSDPRIDKLIESMSLLTESVTGITAKNKADERGLKISAALKDAKIPDTMHKRFSLKEDATDEELTTAITEYRQELADLGLPSLITPGAGVGGKGSLEVNAENAANLRNKGGTKKGGTPAKEL